MAKKTFTTASEGILFDLFGAELRAHCRVRYKYHRERVVFYQKQAVKFSKEVEELVVPPSYSNTVAQSSQQRFESSRKHHEDKARYFHFAEIHLKQRAYRLTGDEVARLELVPFNL